MSYILANPELIWSLTVQHMQMALIAIGTGILIALPLGTMIVRYRWLAVPVLGTLGILYTIPSLALIILLVPIFGLNQVSVIIALCIYAQVVLVRNVTAGLDNINPAMLEAATGMGMNTWQRWWQVQLPLAMPVIVAGIRLATIIVIGIAAIGAKFGAGGLGTLLFLGIAEGRDDKIWAGAITLAALTLAVYSGLLALEQWLSPPTHV